MINSLCVLITSIPARGHLNCCIGFGDMLKKRGHRVLITQREAFRNLTDGHGFEFIPFDEEIFDTDDAEPMNEWTKMNSRIFRFDGVERYHQCTPEDRESFAMSVKDDIFVDKALAKVINETPNIDVIVSDLLIRFPSIYDSGIPSVVIASLNPLSLYPNGVPAFAGFNTKLRDQVLFDDYREISRKAWTVSTIKIREWYKSCGKDDWADEFDPTNFLNYSVDLGFYHYPEDLDYHEFGSICPNWYRVEFCGRESHKKFEIPSKLQNLPGKLIFFSMGSLASMDHDVMKMLLKVLSKSPHRFVVSTGACGDQLELYDNMWGEPYVDQIAILQTVDLVITHGGNNTLMETLYYAQPMIVIPYFFDQLDNAQRVEEKQVGRRINIWDFDEEKLLDTIEDVLKDDQIKTNVKKNKRKYEKINKPE